MLIEVSDHESRELAGAARRMCRALVRRAALGDVDALVQLRDLRDTLPEVLGIATKLATTVGPYKPEHLTTDLGVSRQAVRKLAQREVSADGWTYYTKGMDL